jgi:hypothetical protein
MIAAVIILGLTIGFLLVYIREQAQRAQTERQSLLDRIQHPESRQVAAGEPTTYALPKDEAEMAYVGGFVPDGISVGMTDD